MKRLSILAAIGLLAALLAGCCHLQPDFIKAEPQAKKHDVVVLHGFTNGQPWSDPFLDVLLTTWGSGRVFAVYTNDPDKTSQRTIRGRTLIVAGVDDSTAGLGGIDKQAAIFARAAARLQKEHGLSSPFYIIAHSMGGLVARRYIYLEPGQVAGLVTLGTPHHGSPLADSFEWAGHFLGAMEAVKDLQPARVERFNREYPVTGAPLAGGGRVMTVRGNCPDVACLGQNAEMVLGWNILKSVNHTDNDGLVPRDAAIITGAEHIADCPNHNHQQLVVDPRVALEVSRHLP